MVRMSTYSTDLRQRILRSGSRRTIADLFGMSLTFVDEILRQNRATGDIAPKPQQGGQKPRLDGAAQTAVQQLVEANPEAPLEELCMGIAGTTELRVSMPKMCRVLRHPEVSPQKKSLNASAREKPRVQ